MGVLILSEFSRRLKKVCRIELILLSLFELLIFFNGGIEVTSSVFFDEFLSVRISRGSKLDGIENCLDIKKLNLKSGRLLWTLSSSKIRKFVNW